MFSKSEFDKNYEIIKENIAKSAEKAKKSEKDIILLAATKTQDIETINYAIKSGIEYIGENRVQEFTAKRDFYLPCHKHFIGHLQTNKVKDIIKDVELIHSVDSYHLACEISKQAKKNDVVANILLEVNIGGEESKSGLKKSEVNETLYKIAELPFISIKGLMAIPPVSETKDGNAPYFDQMYKLFIDNRCENKDNISMDILSMGMSDDYECAIEHGANLVRIGTSLFGKRIYK
ncbi:MAG: YggS family pyridoxal phosphate-dependent enzyme [Clostridia bacterium]|nr:YggS family pyridoxal phosphate-dependent enzyme [Clostridia bacterium]